MIVFTLPCMKVYLLKHSCVAGVCMLENEKKVVEELLLEPGKVGARVLEDVYVVLQNEGVFVQTFGTYLLKENMGVQSFLQ